MSSPTVLGQTESSLFATRCQCPTSVFLPNACYANVGVQPLDSGLRKASAYVFCPLMLSAVLTKALESRGCLVLILHAPWWLTVLWFGINDRLVPCQAISPLGVGCGIYSALQAVRDSCKPFCKNSLEFLGLWKPLTAVVGVMCPLFWHWIGL